MSTSEKIIDLLYQKRLLEFELGELAYGSIEVRERDNYKYIYVHVREDGIQLTKYVGEYSEILYNFIIENNERAKELKKNIREVNKKLKNLNYIDEDLSKDISLNIDYAKRHIVDTIYNQAILEGLAVTYLDTQSIIENGIVNNMNADAVLKIINLKHAWDFILNKSVILSKTSYSILCNINKLIEEGFYYSAGCLRTIPVKIGGTSWIPSIPIESDIKDDIDNIIISDKDDLDIAIDLLLYVCKKQMFIDGNKRTAVVFANHFLISKGKGLIVIPSNKVDKYKKLLINYYENNEAKDIIKFLKDDCYSSLKV